MGPGAVNRSAVHARSAIGLQRRCRRKMSSEKESAYQTLVGGIMEPPSPTEYSGSSGPLHPFAPRTMPCLLTLAGLLLLLGVSAGHTQSLESSASFLPGTWELTATLNFPSYLRGSASGPPSRPVAGWRPGSASARPLRAAACWRCMACMRPSAPCPRGRPAFP